MELTEFDLTNVLISLVRRLISHILPSKNYNIICRCLLKYIKSAHYLITYETL